MFTGWSKRSQRRGAREIGERRGRKAKAEAKVELNLNLNLNLL
jgi:hypothetical protein